MDDERAIKQRVVAAAAGLLGCGSDVDSWSTIKSTGRSMVLRGEGFVAKHPIAGRSDAFVHEVAALRYVGRRFEGLAPKLVAVDEANAVMLLEDLGDQGSLADALLGDDRPLALLLLNQYVDALAALHTRTLDTGDDQALSADWLQHTSDRALESLSKRQTHMEPQLSGTALSEAQGLVERLGPRAPTRVLSFGDMCPDNNVQTPSGLRFFDLEVAGYLSPAIDVAYLTMPFPSCWCSFDLPPDVRHEALERYRRQTSHSAGIDDHHVAQLFFAMVTAGAIVPRLIEEDEPPIVVQGALLPTGRARVLHRLARAIEHPAAHDQYPALSSWMQSVHEHYSDHWSETVPVALAPAFRVPT